MPTRRVLVTGGSGFIGTHLVEAVLDDGADLLNVDVQKPPLCNQRQHWCDLDLRDAKGIERTVAGYRPNVIFNLAAVADSRPAGDALLPNTQGLRNLAVASATLSSPPRLLHVSTQLVVKAGYAPKSVRDYAPYTEYGKSKAASEEILWNEAPDLDWTVLRPTNVWGPRHATFPASTWKYLNCRWYPLPSGLDPVRSYGYVTNVVGQMIAASKAEPAEVKRRIFYVASSLGSARLMSGLRGFARRVARRLRPRPIVKAASRTVLRRGVVNRRGRGVVNLIDVGSAGGLPGEWRHHAYRIRSLLNFEPLASGGTSGSVISVPAALWRASERRDFYVYRGDGSGNSLLRQNVDYVREHFEELRHRGPRELANTWFDRAEIVQTLQIETTTLDEVLDSLGGGVSYHFLKVDAQGADLAILQGAERFIREDCVGIQLEAFTIPLLQKAPLLEEIDVYLSARGLDRVRTEPPHGTFDSQHDVVYLRRGATPSPALDAIKAVYDLK